MTVRVAFGRRGNRLGVALGAIAFVALAAAPWWGGRDDLQLFSEIYAYVALASLWNLLAGYAGLVSVGQQAYVGLGAYSLFALALLFRISPLWSIPLTSLPAAVVIAIAPTRQLRDFTMYWIALLLAAAVLALIVLLLRSRYGLALKAMRDR